MASKSKTKGARGEREVCDLANKALGTKYRRTPQSGGMDLKGDIRQAWGGKPSAFDKFHKEVKRCEKLSLPKWIRQSEADARSGDMPCVIYRQSEQPWRIDLDYVDFLYTLQELDELREKIKEMNEIK